VYLHVPSNIAEVTIEVHTEPAAEEVVAAAAPLTVVFIAPITETASISTHRININTSISTLAKSEVPEEEFDGIYLDGDEFEDEF
jgi:hypothetical protein